MTGITYLQYFWPPTECQLITPRVGLCEPLPPASNRVNQTAKRSKRYICSCIFFASDKIYCTIYRFIKNLYYWMPICTIQNTSWYPKKCQNCLSTKSDIKVRYGNWQLLNQGFKKMEKPYIIDTIICKLFLTSLCFEQKIIPTERNICDMYY